MSSIQNTIDAVERLLNRKQMVPSKLMHDLLTDCKALLILTKQQDKVIEQLRTAAKAEAES